MLHKDYDLSGRDPHGAWRQYELIGGKPPVVKWLRLWLCLWRFRLWVSELANCGSAVVSCYNEKLVAAAGVN
jgi:hypothetical protein